MSTGLASPPNPRLQRTPLRAPLSRKPLGAFRSSYSMIARFGVVVAITALSFAGCENVRGPITKRPPESGIYDLRRYGEIFLDHRVILIVDQSLDGTRIYDAAVQMPTGLPARFKTMRSRRAANSVMERVPEGFKTRSLCVIGALERDAKGQFRFAIEEAEPYEWGKKCFRKMP